MDALGEGLPRKQTVLQPRRPLHAAKSSGTRAASSEEREVPSQTVSSTRGRESGFHPVDAGTRGHGETKSTAWVTTMRGRTSRLPHPSSSCRTTEGRTRGGPRQLREGRLPTVGSLLATLSHLAQLDRGSWIYPQELSRLQALPPSRAATVRWSLPTLPGRPRRPLPPPGSSPCPAVSACLPVCFCCVSAVTSAWPAATHVSHPPFSL